MEACDIASDFSTSYSKQLHKNKNTLECDNSSVSVPDACTLSVCTSLTQVTQRAYKSGRLNVGYLFSYL